MNRRYRLLKGAIWVLIILLVLIMTLCIAFICWCNMEEPFYIWGLRPEMTTDGINFIGKCSPEERKNIQMGDTVYFTDGFVYEGTEYSYYVSGAVTAISDGYVKVADKTSSDASVRIKITQIEEILKYKILLPTVVLSVVFR